MVVAVPPEDIHRAGLIALRRLLAEEKADPAKLMREAFQQVLAYRLRLVGRAIVRACGFSVQGAVFWHGLFGRAARSSIGAEIAR